MIQLQTRMQYKTGKQNKFKKIITLVFTNENTNLQTRGNFHKIYIQTIKSHGRIRI